LTSQGWRKRTGEIYTFDLTDGFHGWLGLNRATKYRPLQINPVVGLRHEPLMRLIDELSGTKQRYVAATISSPVGYLTPEHRFLQLSVDSLADVDVAADELVRLVEKYGLPFARAHASTAELERALRDGTYLVVREYAIKRLPALLAVAGRHDEARTVADSYLASISSRRDPAAEHDRAFAAALASWIESKSAS
jgi:hypothetical protein